MNLQFIMAHPWYHDTSHALNQSLISRAILDVTRSVPAGGEYIAEVYLNDCGCLAFALASKTLTEDNDNHPLSVS